jgi:hypothetical protein
MKLKSGEPSPCDVAAITVGRWRITRPIFDVMLSFYDYNALACEIT